MPNKEKVQQLQMIEQSLQQFLMQRQQLQSQLLEINSALSELDKTKKSYKIIGNIMVLTQKEDLKKDLTDKKQILDIQIKNLEKQEAKIKEKAQNIRKEVMNNIKNEE